MPLFSNSVLLDSLVLFALSLPLAKLVLDRRNSHFAVLSGPRSNNLLFGKLREAIGVVDNPAAVFDRWISEYGYVFKVPTGLGTNRIVISDPKAVAHVYANDSFGYLRQNLPKALSRALSGHSMLSVDKEDHRRQRRALAPAFTNVALRESMSIFYDSAYKLKGAWDALFESHDEVTIDVQQWINNVTLVRLVSCAGMSNRFFRLDSIGIAGFGHDLDLWMGTNLLSLKH